MANEYKLWDFSFKLQQISSLGCSSALLYGLEPVYGLELVAKVLYNWNPHLVIFVHIMPTIIILLFAFRIQLDMDEPSSHLIGAHGYCTQVFKRTQRE